MGAGHVRRSLRRVLADSAPKTTGLPDWPAQDGSPDHNSWMSLRPGGSRLVTDFEAAHQCPFWATLKGTQ